MCEHKAQAEDPRVESADHLRGLLAETTTDRDHWLHMWLDAAPKADLDQHILIDGGDPDARPHQAAFENAGCSRDGQPTGDTDLDKALAEGRAKNGTAEAGHG